MPRDQTNTVLLRLPPGKSLSDAMSEIRVWLDHRKIQPVEFRVIRNGTDLALEIELSSENNASRFRSACRNLQIETSTRELVA